jgi:hypothetical protein
MLMHRASWQGIVGFSMSCMSEDFHSEELSEGPQRFPLLCFCAVLGRCIFQVLHADPYPAATQHPPITGSLRARCYPPHSP